MEDKNLFKLPFTLNDFFTTQEQRDDAKKEKIETLDISLLDSFKNHPFKVLENEDLKKLQESINDNGVLEPLIVRKTEDGRYELVSGHRRKRACELNGIDKVPCLIRDMSDDEATIYMVDSNMHREVILPSEKAFAYKMKLDAIKHQGIKTKVTLGPIGQKQYSRDLLSNDVNDSSRNIQRYIRLTNLIPELLKCVDNTILNNDSILTIGLRPAVELSYLDKDEQQLLYDRITYFDSTPTQAQAIIFRKLSDEGKLDIKKIDSILNEERQNKPVNFKIQISHIKEVLPKKIDEKNAEKYIIDAIKYYTNYLEKKKSRER